MLVTQSLPSTLFDGEPHLPCYAEPAVSAPIGSVAVMTDHWSPASESEMVEAIANGTFVEHHHFEVKRETGESPSERKELARDFAGLALDGGVLLVGVEENKKEHTWHLEPQPLQGLGERLEQIAERLIDPPLPVRARDLRSTDDPTRGYVAVTVPASPRGPHMVDGAYYGRGEKTRRRLSDTEVRQLHAARRDLGEQISDFLDQEIARDPFPIQESSGRGHLYLVAHPLHAGLHAARQLVRTEFGILRAIKEETPPRPTNHWEPTPRQARTEAVRAEGYAFCTEPLASGRQVPEDAHVDAELYSADIEFREDAGIRVYLGGLVRAVQYTSIGEETVIADQLAADYVHGLLQWAAGIADNLEYFGLWAFGIAANGLQGHTSSIAATNPRSRHHRPRYDQATYRATTTATLTELQNHPHTVADHLLGSLAYALGSHNLLQQYFQPSTQPDRQPEQ